MKPILRAALLDDGLWFPDPRRASRKGLVAIGGRFTTERLLLAYHSGIFPWTSDPATWWSPDPRAIFEPGLFRVPRSLAKELKREPFRVTMDQSFEAVMRGCAEPAPGRESTWITEDFVSAYTELHHKGHAHSLECWQGERLVGGIYGVHIGGFFAGESMFHRVSAASKVALYHLVQTLRAAEIDLFDTQMLTPVTASLGAIEIPRDEYLHRLEAAVRQNRAWPGTKQF